MKITPTGVLEGTAVPSLNPTLTAAQTGGPLSPWVALDEQGKTVAKSTSRGVLHRVLSRTHRPDSRYGVHRWIPKTP